MAKYLLDANVLIDQFRGHREIATLLNRLLMEGHRLGTCSIAGAEFFSGLIPALRERAWDFLSSLDYYRISAQAARDAGQIRYDYARKGITLSVTDTLIAATALQERAILVTANVRHFPLPELQVLPTTAGG